MPSSDPLTQAAETLWQAHFTDDLTTARRMAIALRDAGLLSSPGVDEGETWAHAALSPEVAACTVRCHGLVLEEDVYLAAEPDPSVDPLELWRCIAEIAAYQIKAAGPEGEASNQEGPAGEQPG